MWWILLINGWKLSLKSNYAINAGSKLTRPSDASSASMAALSTSLSGASDAAPRFSTSRARDDAFGIGTSPRSRDQRRQSCAGVQPSPRAVASLKRVGARNSAGSPCARGQCAMTLSTPAARAVSSSSLCGSRGCSSVCRTCSTTVHVLSVNQGPSRSIQVNPGQSRSIKVNQGR